MEPIYRYKLMTQEMTTHGGMTWELGKTNRAIFPGTNMCSSQLLHCYADPNLAVLFNPAHADIRNPRLFKILCSEIVADDGLKQGCKEQTPVEELMLPTWYTNQKAAFAIQCALLVYREPSFVTWAENWLSGTDRSDKAADAAARAARAARAADAADAAARAAARAAADAAADAAAEGAYAADAADAAARAAAYAARAAEPINFIELSAWCLANIE